MKSIPGDEKIYYPLTHAQKRIYYDEIKFPGTSWAIIGYIVRYKEELDFNLLAEAINITVLRNEGLRLRIVEIGHEILQYISPYKEISVDCVDFSGPGSEQCLQEWIHKNSQKPFVLIDHDLYYFSCIKFNDEEYGYYMKTHHIVSDGWTCALLITEIHEIYMALKTGKRIDDEPNPSYLRYISDEQDYLSSKQAENDKEFWHKKMLPLPKVKDLSEKACNPFNIKADALVLPFPGELCGKMNLFCVPYKTSLYKLVFSTLSIYIAKVSGTDDIIIGGVNHNRTTDLQKKMAGMFVSTIPFRIKVDFDMSFESLLEKIGNDINYIIKNHQKYPFDLLTTELRKISAKDTGSLAKILMVGHSEAKGDNFVYRYIFPGYMTNALTVHFGISGTVYDMLELEYNYQVEKFSQTDIRRIHNGLINILKNALNEPGKKISEIELMTDEEKKQVLYQFNDTSADYPKDKTIHVLFEAQVEKKPGNIALTYKGQQLTYRQLNEKANQLARILRDKGVKPDHIVTVMVERSIDMIIGIMAILKAGGAFLPLDPDCPDESVQRRVEENESHLVLTREKYVRSLDFDADLIYLEKESICQGNKKNLKCINSPKNLAAYVIYISTYLRNPKGVMIEHGAIINTIFTMQSKYPIRESDIYLLKTPFKSTVSISELFGWFLGSGRMHILEKGQDRDTRKILEVIHEQRITHINLIPTMFNRMVNQLISDDQYLEKISQLRYIFLSMEPIAPEIINKFRKLETRVSLVNLYSRTETSIYSSSYPISEWPGSGSIPIGKPINNMKAYILNFIKGQEKPEVMPVGVPGELCLSGIGLARGYIKKEKLTAERFIDNPFAVDKEQDDSYKKIYRTGDLARWLPDGNIEFLGRIEREIEIRETRIDRTEIESHLLKQEKIKEAVVVAREVEGEKYMCAYVVSDEKLDTKQVREALSKSLPAPMIPLYFIQIDLIPLTPEGKTNRGELLDLKQAPHQIEEILAEIEAEVLNLNKEEIDLDANFFALGGHSYKAAQMVTKIQKAFNTKISMAELFKRPTLRQLSEYLTESIETKYSSIEAAESKQYYPQSSAQQRLYFLQQMEKNSTVYNIQMMDIYCKGFEKEKLEDAFKKLIKRHEILRTSFHMLEGESVQKIHDYAEVGANFAIEYYEAAEDGKICSWEPGKDSECAKMEGKDFEEVIKSFVSPFELGIPPLLRVGFIKILHNTKILMLDMHHIIADGISMEILAREIWEFYDGEKFPQLRLQYKDFSQWLNSEDRINAVKEQQEFWLKEFAGDIPIINLPTDYHRPAMLSFEGDTIQFELDKEESRQLHLIAQEHDETLYMVLFAIYNVLLAKISGQEDIVVGTITAGRGHEDLQNIVGMFVNTLALRNYPEGEKNFEDFLMEVRIATFAALENQDYPFEKLVSQVAPRQETNRNPLFDVAFGLENEADPTGYLMEVAIPDKSKPYDFNTRNSKFDMTLVCIEIEDGLECVIEYKTKLFKPETILRFIGYFKKIVSSICCNLRQKIGEISVISEEEKKQIILAFNNTKVEYPRDKTIQECFEILAEKTPGNIALSCQGETLTYREFNEKANQLARVLKEKGIKPDHLVGIMVERSMEMIIGIFAIIKAGGAYLPIDPNYPEDRIRYLWKDSGSSFLLTLYKFLEFAGAIDFQGEIINLQDQSLYQGEGQNPGIVNSPNDLAYIIYTSGSTGLPKGVMIEHVSAVNLLLTMDRLYPLEESDAYLLKTAFLFDVSVSEIFGWFWRGGRLAILKPQGEKDPLMMIDTIEEEKITHINFVPSLFNIFVGMLDQENIVKLSTLKYIFLAGEAIWPESINKFRAFATNIVIENLYGPTESTIYASWYPVSGWKGIGSVSIGKPIDNLQLYILSSDDKVRPELQPIGFAGELTISGIGLARGYLNRPLLTSEKFVENTAVEKDKADKTFRKLYHTGDLCRWFSDGNIEYMGRIDFQVKVRGFRIELGEIESKMLKIPGINEAVVIAREDREGGKYLCAYYITDETLGPMSIRNNLLKELPEYMVPSYFVPIDAIPLNRNGKLDRKALPLPSIEADTREYAAPENEIEEVLANVWAEVLGTERISVDDNFFEIGGDSIKAIQIVSKLQKSQFKLEVGQMFLHKTVRQLAAHLKPVVAGKIRIPEQGIVKGSVGLTPIQKWLFNQHFSHCHHFNQAVTLHRKGRFDEKIIEKVFTKIIGHHDALRMVYKYNRSHNAVIQKNRDIDGKLFHLEVISLENEADENAAIKHESIRIQSSIDLQQGPLVKLGLFKHSQDNRLLIVIHHLVVDAISWRILLEDFETGYQQALEGKGITFQEKSDSFKYWSERLEDYAESKPLLDEIHYWRKLEDTEVKSIPVDQKITRQQRKFQYHDRAYIVLSEEKTRLLFTKVNRAYNTEINDILLTALGLAIKQWSGLGKIRVTLEGHGREQVIEGTDITRTVGWFTTQYPIILDMEKPGDISSSIKKVKEMLRGIPNKGIGYGILKYLTPQEKKQGITFKPAAEILFNYLGKFEERSYVVIDKISGITDLSYDDWWNPEMDLEPKIDIEGVVEKESLKLAFFYSTREYEKETIETLAGIFKTKLGMVIDHCREKEFTEYTPSDLGYQHLSIDDLARITRDLKENIYEEVEIESIYPLSPMQNGMFYHSLKNKESNAYFEQMIFSLRGEIDVALLQESINRIMDRYGVLRTVLTYLGLDEPLQIVLKKRKSEIYYEDISRLNQDEQGKHLEEFNINQQKRGFDLTRDVLIRFSLFKKGLENYLLHINFHHIIMDGWCLFILLKEIRQIYRSLGNDRPLKLEPVTQYIEYVNWIQKQDKDEGLRFWEKYLDAYEEPALLPKNGRVLKKDEYQLKEYRFIINEQLTTAITQLSAKNHVTISSILQTLWGVLLQKYNNRHDVVYGTIVSGRSVDIQNIENMLGLFINMIPVRIKSTEHLEFSKLLSKVQESAGLTKKYEYLPVSEIQAHTELKSDLIDHIMVFENYPIDEELKNPKFGFIVEGMQSYEQTNYDFNVVFTPGTCINGIFNYNALVYDMNLIENIALHFLNVVRQIVNDPQINITNIEIITDDDKKLVLDHFNDTESDYPRDKTINELFEAVVNKYPDIQAVVGMAHGPWGTQLTYKELNAKTNQLGTVLRSKGIQHEAVAAIMVESCQEMIIGLMGILKAGGAFLPIDPKIPADRIKYILEESGTQYFLTRKELLTGVDYKNEIISLDNADIYKGKEENLPHVNTPGDMAYIIYTSGSTGKPKGVVVEHRSLINLCSWHNKYYSVTPADRATKYAGFGFDASVWEVFPYLVIGAAIYIVPEEIKLDIQKLNRYFEDNGITISFLPTQMCEQFMTIENQSLRVLLTGGDKLKTFVRKNYQLYNNYGPTENTVVTTSCPVNELTTNIPIGKPLDNNQVYILSNSDILQPIGAAGELCIGGESLARGYLNKPFLTEEKFVHLKGKSWLPAPVTIYRTGDLSRWLWDGDIEFLGRIDYQVKIRGFRIELGEIENQLMDIEEIKEVIVIARESKEREGEKYICAYVVANGLLDISSVRKELLQKIPDYMVPSYISQLEKMPLNPSGKIDRKALPEPQIKGEEYVAPTNENEEILAGIWSEVLGMEKISIDKNFFDIGGDSIKTILISSRLRIHQLVINVNDFFLYPTIRRLAKHVKKMERIIPQEIVTGNVNLTPIQKWFFKNHLPYGSHFNQSVLLYRKKGFNEEMIKKVFTKIVEHHDALRMIYSFEKDADAENIFQQNRGIDDKLFNLEVKHLEIEKVEKAVIKREALWMQKSIDLKNGPLVKLGMFKGLEGDYLSVIIHHLVVDGISWRILLEDFETGYQQLLKNKEISFQDKTDSFQYWALKLMAYAESNKMFKELAYWKEIEDAEVKSLPVDHDIANEQRKFQYYDIVSMVLSEKRTQQLLTRVNWTYNTEINDVLITALGLAVKQWTGLDKVLVNLEGHGREEIIEDINISRTVGWFSTQYPVILDMKQSEDISYSLRSVKETLKRIPNKGIGYGILKFLTPPEKKESLQFKQTPEIVFNYLGEFGEESYAVIDELSGITDLNIEDNISPDFAFSHKIDIEGIIINGKLKLVLFYNKYEYEKETIENLAEMLNRNLERVIDHCLEKKEREFTPSDLGYNKISIEELEQITHHIKSNISKDMEIQFIYPLSPMQVGMLYHSLKDEESHGYFEQNLLTLRGEIDQLVLEESLNKLIERYDVFRTIFAYKELQEPMQVVLKEKKMKMTYEDISHLDKKEQLNYIENSRMRDRERGFILDLDLLVRYALFKAGPDKHFLLWSFHHTLMDGWCLGIILEELKKIYQLLKKGKSVELDTSVPYVNYINWLQKQDKEEGLNYWKTYLESYDQPAGLLQSTIVMKKDEYKEEEFHFSVDDELNNGINQLSVKNHVTLNTVFQTIWGILLQKYNNREDVVFGSIVSGRPSEIEGIERMVGLFINMVPVRIKSTKEQRFLHLLRYVQDASVSSRRYEYLPVAEIQSLSELKGELINHLMVFENYPIEELLKKNRTNGEGGFHVEKMEIFEQTNYDFNIIVMPWERLHINFSYNALVYSKDLMENTALHFEKVLKQVVNKPDVLIQEIEIITEKEKSKILYEFNDTIADYPKDKTIYQVFEAQMQKEPDNAAVIFRDKWLSYREFNEKANQLARLLREKGIKPDHIAAVLVERSLEMMIGIFAILKAGGAYMPIEPNYPRDRIDYILEDSECKLLLTLEKFMGIADFTGEIINLEDESLYSTERDNLDLVNTSRDMAYIIYTSGSTGRPKGVIIEHQAAINRINWMQKFYPLDCSDVILQKTTYVFDVSVWELFWWSFIGASQYLLIPGGEKSPEDMIDAIEKNKISTMHFVPSMLNTFLGYIEGRGEEVLRKAQNFRQVFASGEALTPHQVEKFNQLIYKRTNAVLINLYGPTEATVDVSYFDCPTRGKPDKVPIGKPIDNINLFVVNDHFDLEAIGVTGELCITGDGLARGYLNRIELTSEKFIANPIDKSEGWGIFYKRLYRTGDLARWLPDGNIDYLGRIDFQVKVRGFRIELGEIESKLLDIEDIKDAVVLAREDKNKEKYLCAYLISDEKLDISSIRDTLSVTLTDYMIPSYFVQIDEFPLTPNGKLDRKALPEPESAVLTTEYVAPSNEIEKALSEVWAEVLGIEKVGIDDNFFEIGGNSIKTILVSGRLFKRGINAKVNDFFSNKTIRELAKCVEKTGPEVEKEVVLKDEKIIAANLNKDYDRYLGKVKQEEWPDLTVENDYRYILLTGTTGYLGAYLLYELLDKTSATLYLPVRGASQVEAEGRLKKKIAFYFGEEFINNNSDRMVIMKGDLTEKQLGINNNQYEKLCENVDAVVHSAARVKHYGDYQELYKDNVEATEHLLEFAAIGKKKDFHFISTLDTGSGDIPGKDYLLYTEYVLDEGQESDNVYVKSKFEAEKRVLAYREKGLNTSVYRAGNITFHSQTGLFQENIEENFFYSLLKALIKVGFLAEKIKTLEFDLSFVDHAARAIVLLLTRKSIKNQICHISNPHKMSWDEMADLLKKSGITPPVVETGKLKEHLAQYEGDSEYETIIERVNLYSWIWEKIPKTLTVPKIDRTVKLLTKLGFEWPKIDKKYIEKMIFHCKKVGFIS